MPGDDVPDMSNAAMLGRLNQAMVEAVPFNAALRLSCIEFGPGMAKVRLPWREELVGLLQEPHDDLALVLIEPGNEVRSLALESSCH